jgi:hypothetical protein
MLKKVLFSSIAVIFVLVVASNCYARKEAEAPAENIFKKQTEEWNKTKVAPFDPKELQSRKIEVKEIIKDKSGHEYEVVFDKKDFRLLFEPYPNMEVLAYHVKKQVTENTYLCFHRNEHPEEQPILAKRLFEIKGIKEVRLSQNKIEVVFSPAFDYDQMRKNVEQTILDRYGIKR